MLLQAAPKDGNVSLPVQLNVTSSTIIKNTHWNEWQNHHWLQKQRTLSEKKKKYWKKMVGLQFSYVHHISFCIKVGSANRKAKPTILWTDVIVLSTSACLAAEGNDSTSPQITRSCFFPLLLHPDTLGVSLQSSGTQSNTCLKSLFPHSPPLNCSSYCMQNQNIRNGKGREGEVSGIEKSMSKHRGAGHQSTHCSKNRWVLDVLQQVFIYT